VVRSHGGRFAEEEPRDLPFAGTTRFSEPAGEPRKRD